MAETSDSLLPTNSPAKGTTLSTSTSSFEALDPHDPNLSRLATTMFQKTSDYLYGEITTTQDNYNLVEKLNTITITKYSDMKQLSSNITKTIEEYNKQYTDVVKPLLLQIDEIEKKAMKLEEIAYEVDNVTKQLVLRFKSIKRA